MVIQSVNACIAPYLEAYKGWISSKPQVIGDIESTVRCLSYLTAGRFSNSSLISELIYSMPNLLILLNDRLIYSTKYSQSHVPQFRSQIKIWLTIIEYTEALLEVSANKLWGEYGKWLVIFIVQTFKAVMKLILVHHNKERITQNPAIPPLNREQLHKESQKEELPKEGFVLKRSGTTVRSVNASGPIQSRIWAPLTPIDDEPIESECPRTRRNLLLAETLYIMKPLVHLAVFVCKGKQNWLPWTSALLLDLISLQLITVESKRAKLTKVERQEMCRRRINLLLYILRSPFYDNCSRVKIYSLLQSVSRNVPFARFVAEPIAKYLPHWQKTYFYMWSC